MWTGLTLRVTDGHARAVSDGLTAAACNVLCPDARGSAECKLPRLQLSRNRFGLACVRLVPEFIKEKTVVLMIASSSSSSRKHSRILPI